MAPELVELKSEEEVLASLVDEAGLNKEVVREAVDLFLSKCLDLSSDRGKSLGPECNQLEVDSFSGFNGFFRVNDVVKDPSFLEDGFVSIVLEFILRDGFIEVPASDIDLGGFNTVKTPEGDLRYNFLKIANKPHYFPGSKLPQGYMFYAFHQIDYQDGNYLAFDSETSIGPDLDKNYMIIVARLLSVLIRKISEEESSPLC